MSFYSLSKKQREELVAEINADIRSGIQKNSQQALLTFFSDEDTSVKLLTRPLEKSTLKKKRSKRKQLQYSQSF